MINKEEKQAIEFIEFYKKHCLKEELENIDNYKTMNDEEFVSYNLTVLLNLIKKQSKEIERQKGINKEHQELNGRLRQYIKELEEKVKKYKSNWE